MPCTLRSSQLTGHSAAAPCPQLKVEPCEECCSCMQGVWPPRTFPPSNMSSRRASTGCSAAAAASGAVCSISSSAGKVSSRPRSDTFPAVKMCINGRVG